MSLLERLGQDPQCSMQRFLCGLGFFIAGIAAVFIGYYQHHIWQMIGIALLAFGIVISAWGYVGIFANRMYHSFNRKH